MSRATDIAWAAGLFEGEGCFSSKNVASLPRASMSMTDKDVIDRFHRIVGVGSMVPVKSRKPHHKPAWQWYTRGEQEYRYVFDLLKPHLGFRRLKTGAEAIAHREQYTAAVTGLRLCVVCGEGFTTGFGKSASRRSYCCEGCYQDERNRRAREKAALNRSVFQPQRIRLPEDEGGK